jgi:hypothetical protein
MYSGHQISFPGIKRPERGLEHPARAEVKETVQGYLFSPSGPPPGPVTGRHLFFYFSTAKDYDASYLSVLKQKMKVTWLNTTQEGHKGRLYKFRVDFQKHFQQ